MQRSSCSRFARWMVFTAALTAIGVDASDASAAGRYGFVPVPGTGRASSQTRPATERPFTAGNPAQCGAVTYCGGPVISNVQVLPVYWTDQVSTSITSWAETYLTTLANSELLDMLSEYSTTGLIGEACGMETDAGLEYFGPATAFSTYQKITRGTALPAVTITPITTTSTDIDDDGAAIGTELTAQIAAGNLQAPTYDAQGYPNTLYFVFFPSSYNITLQGMGSCQEFGGYHQSVTYTGHPSCKGQYVPYAVIPDCGIDTEGLSSVCSHELSEAITDTDVGPTSPATSNYGDGAWYLGPTYPCNSIQNCPSNCGEVGDVCVNHGDSTVPGTSIVSQDIWSQAQNGCTVSDPSTAAQPPPAGPPLATCAVPVEAGAPEVDASAPSSDAGAHDSGTSGSSGSDAGLSGYDAGGPTTGRVDSGANDSGPSGFGDSPGGSSSGCGCWVTPESASGGAWAIGGLLALAGIARKRRR